MRARKLIVLVAMVAAAEIQAPPRVGVGVIERKLTLEQALEMALKNNLEIEIERTGVSLSQQQLRAAQGAFDGTFRWAPVYERRNAPTSSILLGADGKLLETFHNQDFTYRQRLHWQGASLVAGFDNSRQSTSNPFTGLNPYTQSRLVFSFTQPLWRNRLIDRERGELRIRSRQIEQSQIDLELRVIDIATRVELAYWDLVAARQDVNVKADGVDWAREQLARNRRMIASGTLAPVELVAAEAELERRLDTYYASVGTLTEAENSLRTLLAGSHRDDVWSDVVVPVEETALEATATDDLRQAVNLALSKRPELRGLTVRRETTEVEKSVAADQLKPQLNLVASAITAGLGGAVSDVENPFARANVSTALRINELSARAGLPALPPVSFGGTPQSLVGGYGTTLSNLFAGYQTYQVGLQMDWNPRNRAAQASLQQAVINQRRLDLERTRIEQAIAAQVRNALQAIQTARQRIAASESSARAAKEKLDSETRLFQNGESTNFFVLTRQNEYTDSLRRVLVSRLELNKAVARLHTAQGTTLEAHKLSVR
jgi:HAE1 family hydrophobic/amphiphilic exporter-1